MKEFDFFISHAHEDRITAALPIAEGLTAKGYRVWVDVGQLAVGDGLFKNVNHGLAKARFGVVIVSHAFLAKTWPQWELEGLAALESAEGRKVILPVWHGVTLQEIAATAPILAGRIGTNTAHGLDRVIDDLVHAVERDQPKSLAESLKRSGIPALAELSELEPLDLYADAEEELARGHDASQRIVAAMRTFTARANEFNAENRALATTGARLGPRVLRARVNQLVPMFDDYGLVIDQNVTAFGESMGRAFLLMTRALVLDEEDTAARKQQWLSTLTAVEQSALEALAVAERSYETTTALAGRTVDMKHAKRRLETQLSRFVRAHQQAIDDIRQAKRLLRPEEGPDDAPTPPGAP